MTYYQPPPTMITVDPRLTSNEYNQASKLSTMSLAAGIAGMIVLPIFGSMAAVIMGSMAKRKTAGLDRQLTASINIKANVGLVLGWFGVGVMIMSLLFYVLIIVVPVLILVILGMMA